MQASRRELSATKDFIQKMHRLDNFMNASCKFKLIRGSRMSGGGLFFQGPICIHYISTRLQ